MSRQLLLIHGLLNADIWLYRLAGRLREAGFEPRLFSYSSLLEGPPLALPRLIERLGAMPHGSGIVGHSLGGLMALEALRQAPGLPVDRVMCLGSPLRGSQTARAVAARAWTRPMLGRSAGLLQTGLQDWNGPAQVGMVAGDLERGLGRLFTRFDGPSDGTVGVGETRLPGLADHCIVRASHSGLVFSESAAAQAVHFLRDGRFRR